jgi:hypothetical protein
MDGTVNFDCSSLGEPNNLNNFVPTQSVFVKLFKACQREEHSQFLHLQCPISKLSKFRIKDYSDIVVRGQNP